MKDRILDNLITDGSIVSYEYEQTSDVNRYNEEIVGEKLTLVFPSGHKLTVSANAYLLIVDA